MKYIEEEQMRDALRKMSNFDILLVLSSKAAFEKFCEKFTKINQR